MLDMHFDVKKLVFVASVTLTLLLSKKTFLFVKRGRSLISNILKGTVHEKVRGNTVLDVFADQC